MPNETAKLWSRPLSGTAEMDVPASLSFRRGTRGRVTFSHLVSRWHHPRQRLSFLSNPHEFVNLPRGLCSTHSTQQEFA